MGAIFLFWLPQKKLCCCLHHILLCSPIPFIIIFPFRPWYDGKSTNAQSERNEIQSCKISALKQRLLRQSVHIHKLCIQCSHLFFYLPKKFFPCFRYKKWEVPLSHTKMWRTGTSLWCSLYNISFFVSTQILILDYEFLNTHHKQICIATQRLSCFSK